MGDAGVFCSRCGGGRQPLEKKWPIAMGEVDGG